MLNVGVIGCGNIARFHFAGLEKARARIKWVCDVAEKAARPWAERYGASLATDWQRVVAAPDVDAIVIAAISSVHKDICLAAIEAGKAVICEKTLAENADDALAIVRRAEERKTIFYTSYMKRFIPAVAKAKELLPGLGAIISAHVRAHQCWGNVWQAAPGQSSCRPASPEKSAVVAKYGGGILVCGGSHILDLVCFFFGRPRRLFAIMYQPPYLDHDLLAAALMETPQCPVHYETIAHPLHKIGFQRDGWDERIEIVGVEGKIEIFSAKWDEFDSKASLLVHYDNRTGQSIEYRFAPESPFARAIEFFCRQIAKGEQGAQSRITGYDVDELIAHIKISAAERRAVEVIYRI